MQEPKKPAVKTKGQQTLLYYKAFTLLFILTFIIVYLAGEDAGDAALCCTGLIFVLSIIYLALGLASTTKNLIYTGRRNEFTEEWKTYVRDQEKRTKQGYTPKKRKRKSTKTKKRKSKNSEPLVLGEVHDDMSPEMKDFMGSYKDWKDSGGVIPEKSSSSGNSISKNCEHCGFSNSADNNPGWAALCSPEMASFFEGSAGCDLSCINCGLNFWVSTKELTGSGPDIQFESMPGIGDYTVNKMNEMAEKEGDLKRYELPTERAKSAKKKAPSKKKTATKTSSANTLKSKLKDAKTLFEEELIDEEEYKQMKKEILGK